MVLLFKSFVLAGLLLSVVALRGFWLSQRSQSNLIREREFFFVGGPGNRLKLLDYAPSVDSGKSFGFWKVFWIRKKQLNTETVILEIA